jgi:hypothetical protein
MFVPTPCCMPGSVDEKQRDGVGFADTPLVDHLKHVAHVGRLRASAAGAARPGFGVPRQRASPLVGKGSSLDRCNVSPKTRKRPLCPASSRILKCVEKRWGKHGNTDKRAGTATARTAGAENCPWRHVLDCPAASKISPIDACAGKHRAPHRASVLTRRSPGVVGQGNCRVDGIASLDRRHHGMLGVVWHRGRRTLNAGRQRVRRCRFVKHDERRVIGSLDKWRHRRDDWS